MNHRFTVELASASDLTTVYAMMRKALPLHVPLTWEGIDEEDTLQIAIVLNITRTKMSESKSNKETP